jgi:uncharacterized protein (DUF1330 family)
LAAFLVSRVKVTDPVRFEAYRSASIPIVKSFGGEYVARSDKVEALDGHFPGGRVVLIRFPDTAAAHAFWNSPEYRKARELRLGAAELDLWLLPDV